MKTQRLPLVLSGILLCALLAIAQGGTDSAQGNEAVLSDMFTVNDAPVPVKLTRVSLPSTKDAARTEWTFADLSHIAGATATIPMAEGGSLNLKVLATQATVTPTDVYQGRVNAEKIIVRLNPGKPATWLADMEYDFLADGDTWTIAELPDGKFCPARMSKSLYGGRFKVLVALQPIRCHSLHLLDTAEKSKADASGANTAEPRQTKEAPPEFHAIIGVRDTIFYQTKEMEKKIETPPAKPGDSVTVIEDVAEVLRVRLPTGDAAWCHRACLCTTDEWLRRKAKNLVPDGLVIIQLNEKGTYNFSGKMRIVNNKLVPLVDGVAVAYNARICQRGKTEKLWGGEVEPRIDRLWLLTPKGPVELSGWPVATGLASGQLAEENSKGASVEALRGTNERSSLLAMLPAFTEHLNGPREVRVRNPNAFAVHAGVRKATAGVNFEVPANGAKSVYVPDGEYDIYFVYSDKPDALFQGDSFTLRGNGVEIQIVKVVGGNYGIRQVK